MTFYCFLKMAAIEAKWIYRSTRPPVLLITKHKAARLRLLTAHYHYSTRCVLCIYLNWSPWLNNFPRRWSCVTEVMTWSCSVITLSITSADMCLQQLNVNRWLAENSKNYMTFEHDWNLRDMLGVFIWTRIICFISYCILNYTIVWHWCYTHGGLSESGEHFQSSQWHFFT